MPGLPHRIAVGLAIVAAVALLVPSGAAVLPTDSPSDPVGNQVEVAPAPGDGGTHARMVDGALVVDFSGTNPPLTGAGLNPDAVTRVGDVFLIRYTGSQRAEAWVSHEGEGLTVSVAGDPIESPEQAAVLEPNETVAVDVTVRTTDTWSDATDQFTIHTREYNGTGDAGDGHGEHQYSDDGSPSDESVSGTSDADGASSTDGDSTGAPADGDTPASTPETTDAGDDLAALEDGDGDGDEQDGATTAAVERTTEASIDTRTTAFETLMGGGLGWPLGLAAVLALAAAGVLVGRRQRP